MEGCCGKTGLSYTTCTQDSNAGGLLEKYIDHGLQLRFTAMKNLGGWWKQTK
jgi:hypothetical protein